MIRLLRRKFITVAMVSTALVLLAIIGGINVANYININQSADRLMELLEKGGGKFPETEKESDQPPDKPGPPPSEDGGRSPWLKGKHHLPAEAAYKARYFTVTLKEDGSVCSTDTGRIHATSSAQAQKYAKTLFLAGKTEGFLKHYKYSRILLKQDSGRYYLYIFLDCEEDILTFTDFLAASLFFSLIGLLVVFLLVLFFSGKALKPVAESYSKQKRFITDASHEIKTPLTIIDANTELLEMTGEENEWTQSIRNQVRRLTDLTEKLVFLSRMDEENSPFTMVDFSLTEALLDTLAPFSAIAKTKAVEMISDIAPDVICHGDEGYIRQMISLLTDNALKYTPDHGQIRVTLKVQGHIRLTIWNSVDEIEPGNHEELFDRFYRRDASRNSRTGGHGIGLSVVQAIVEAHRGKITCRSADSRSIAFTVQLPQARSPRQLGF